MKYSDEIRLGRVLWTAGLILQLLFLFLAFIPWMIGIIFQVDAIVASSEFGRVVFYQVWEVSNDTGDIILVAGFMVGLLCGAFGIHLLELGASISLHAKQKRGEVINAFWQKIFPQHIRN